MWIGFFSFPSCSRILGIDFFILFPFPNFGNVFFLSLNVPEFREWVFSIPFPFPDFRNYPFPFPFPSSQKSFQLTPARIVRTVLESEVFCFFDTAKTFKDTRFFIISWCDSITGFCWICPWLLMFTFTMEKSLPLNFISLHIFDHQHCCLTSFF